MKLNPMITNLVEDKSTAPSAGRIHSLIIFLRDFASWWDQDCDASPVNMKDQSWQFREAADALSKATQCVGKAEALVEGYKLHRGMPCACRFDNKHPQDENEPTEECAYHTELRIAKSAAEQEIERLKRHIRILEGFRDPDSGGNRKPTRNSI